MFPSLCNWCCCCISDNNFTDQQIEVRTNSETTSIDSYTHELDTPLLPPSTSSMLLSKIQTIRQPNINNPTRRSFNLYTEEYKSKKDDIDKKLKMLDQEFQQLLQDNLSNFNLYNEIQYEYAMIQRKIFRKELPILQSQLLQILDSIDIRQLQSQEHQKIILEINALANQCDPEHKNIITMWLTTFLNDEIRERKIILSYLTNYIKEEILPLFTSDDLQLHKFDEKKAFLLSQLQKNISHNDSVREKEIKKYLEKQPLFQRKIIDIFSELFIHKSCPDL